MAPLLTAEGAQADILQLRPQHQVFINCPFDDDYKRLLFEPMVFTIQACGFMARCALEATFENDRFKRIQDLIEICPVSVHDLSRNVVGEATRFNMPLELGVFIGCKRYGGEHHASKTYLVMDKNKYEYQKYISDINGQDPSIHFDEPINLIKIIRDWLSGYYSLLYNGERLMVPTGTRLFNSYKTFLGEKEDFCKQPKYDSEYDELTFLEQREVITKWWNKKQLEFEFLETALESKVKAQELVTLNQAEEEENPESEQP